MPASATLIETPSLRLYGYWRSSASWRVRWALALKELRYEYVPVNILQGEHKGPENLKRSPLGALPVLELGHGVFINESMAMLEWIHENYPERGAPLFPKDSLRRAHVRALCEIINADTAPLQTPRAQNRHSADATEKADWARHFIRDGLKAFEALSAPHRGKFSMGDEVSLADLFLIPQLYNARRYEIDLAKEFPILARIYEHAIVTPAAIASMPETQSDATPA